MQILLLTLELLFCVYPDAIQSHFSHDGNDPLFANTNTAIRQNDMELSCSKALFTVIKYLLDFQHKLSLFLLIFTAIRPAKDVIVKGSSCNAKSIT